MCRYNQAVEAGGVRGVGNEWELLKAEGSGPFSPCHFSGLPGSFSWLVERVCEHACVCVHVLTFAHVHVCV